jgi:hypothetical protein
MKTYFRCCITPTQISRASFEKMKRDSVEAAHISSVYGYAIASVYEASRTYDEFVSRFRVQRGFLEIEPRMCKISPCVVEESFMDPGCIHALCPYSPEASHERFLLGCASEEPFQSMFDLPPTRAPTPQAVDAGAAAAQMWTERSTMIPSGSIQSAASAQSSILEPIDTAAIIMSRTRSALALDQGQIDAVPQPEACPPPIIQRDSDDQASAVVHVPRAVHQDVVSRVKEACQAMTCPSVRPMMYIMMLKMLRQEHKSKFWTRHSCDFHDLERALMSGDRAASDRILSRVVQLRPPESDFVSLLSVAFTWPSMLMLERMENKDQMRQKLAERSIECGAIDPILFGVPPSRQRKNFKLNDKYAFYTEEFVSTINWLHTMGISREQIIFEMLTSSSLRSIKVAMCLLRDSPDPRSLMSTVSSKIKSSGVPLGLYAHLFITTVLQDIFSNSHPLLSSLIDPDRSSRLRSAIHDATDPCTPLRRSTDGDDSHLKRRRISLAHDED